MSDVEQICQLKYRYLRTLDTKEWDAFGATLTEDVEGRYAGLDLDGRDTLVDYMRQNLGPQVVTLHQCHHPEIEVDGDTATGRWYLQDKVIAPDFDYVLEGAGIYADRYRRVDGEWLIAATGYARTYELTWSLKDLPSAKVTLAPRHDPV
ncbi:nuclear transport factor 2 family protein [Nocardioides limicola]|uniref:nuclear transport factor 2 family protein n=1 Tax=Nocardioides limicola TaxID=2803368 RepID=UPI00193BAA48|nr:nuclear transport factor 2 family protein [Nocardioides sp. DJM-14]